MALSATDLWDDIRMTNGTLHGQQGYIPEPDRRYIDPKDFDAAKSEAFMYRVSFEAAQRDNIDLRLKAQTLLSELSVYQGQRSKEQALERQIFSLETHPWRNLWTWLRGQF